MRRRAFIAAGGLLAAACAPKVQSPLGAALDGAPRLEADRYVAFDGAKLGLSMWEPAGEPWAVIVALHGMNDYAEAFTLAGPWWAERGVATYAYDHRGFGRSPNRGVWGGPELMTEDLRVFVELVRSRHPGKPLVVFGESMGGSVAVAAFASERPPNADRLILSAPGMWGWGSQPLLYRTTLWLGAHVIGGRALSPPDWVTKDRYASDNIEHLRRMGRDRNMIWATRIDAIYGLVNLMEIARENLRRVRAPVLLLYGAHDAIIPPEPVFYAASQLKPGDRSAYYQNGWHLLTRDLQREVVLADVLAWLRDPAVPLPSGAPKVPTVKEAKPSVPVRSAGGSGAPAGQTINRSGRD